MQIGEINNLKVLRKTDIGYLLVNENNTEVFMHFNDTDKEHNADDMVDAFLFYDKKHRLTATTNTPYVTASKSGFLIVKDINPSLGVFLDNNTTKDLFLSEDYLPQDFKQWPKVGDKIIAKIKIKEDNMTARICGKQEIIDEFGVTNKYAVGEKVKAYVCKFTSSGIGLVTEDKQYVFVHQTLLRDLYRLGQEVIVTITQSRDEDFNGTLLANKEEVIDSDCEIILDYLEEHNGFMKYDAKSSSEDIERVFKMSRKAFKRALGSLYKERKVLCDEEGTHLLK